MPKYAVEYEITTIFEAVVTAKNEKEAAKKVSEVIGDPVTLNRVREVK